MTFLALPWFVLATTGSVAKMTYVLAAEILPMALLGIPSGALVERLGARRTMLVCDAARIPLLGSLPLLHSAGLLGFPLLLALVFCLGRFMAPYLAAQRVILPELVGEDERTITQASSLIEGGTALAGPALAGVLILLLAGFVPRTKKLAGAVASGLLPFGPPARGVAAALFAMMLFIPFVNGPVIGTITTRTPAELRPKVMTALISVSMLSAPLGFLAAGQLLGTWESTTVFEAAAVGLTATALVFASIALRHREDAAPEAPAAAA